MYGVDCPEDVDPVREAVPHVVDEVDGEEGDHPGPDRSLAEREEPVLVEPDVSAGDHGHREYQEDLLRHAAREIGDDVGESIEPEAAATRRPQLHSHEQ